MKKFDVRYALWAVVLAAVVAAPLFAGFSRWGWEAAQVAGLWAAVACAVLCGASIRPRQATPPRLLTLRVHTLLGWGALLGVAAHIAGVLLADRTVLEYFRASMPWYELAGIIASLLLLAVTVTAVTGARRGLWKSHRGFQATHVILSCLLLLTLTVHVVTTDRYAGGGVRRVLFFAASLGAVLLLLRARALKATTGEPAVLEPAGRWHRHLVFGRNSRGVAVAVMVTVLLSMGLLVGGARGALREPVIARTEPLVFDFPHGKHVQVNCLTCHHNFADGTGMENCVLCHKSERTDLKQGVQARFHGFCLECHRRPQSSLHGRGPVSQCQACHHTPDAAHP